jgi:hypothetical protein
MVFGLLAALAAALALAALAGAQGAPPLNDNYLDSLRLNDPGSRLDRTHTLVDQRDTTGATVQSDIFNPPRSGGPTEVTTCSGANYGKTVWYDFYPDVSGLVRVRASGYDAVVSVMRFDRTTLLPDFNGRQCGNATGAGGTEELFANVLGGRAYTIQIGGVDDTAGNLLFQFDFLPDTDRDGVLDNVDECRHLPGTARRHGCPQRLSADASIKAEPLPDGLRLLSLRVSATRGARVAVRCSRGCRPQARTARTVSFPGLAGASLPAGSTVTILVTKRKAIGRWIRYRITRGFFTRKRGCLNPGSHTLRRRCG